MSSMAQLPETKASSDPAPPPLTGFQENLSRLSNKPGVIATIVLEKSSGNVLQRRRSASSGRSPLVEHLPSHASKDVAQSPAPTPNEVDEFSTMVWKFMNAAGHLVNDLDSEDEVKLLRLRTKKNELVIVPDSKYILIVVHEMASA